MTCNELNKKLEDHDNWSNGSGNGCRADLSGADLSRANLSRTNLRRADLYCADLSRANFSGADLSGADLYGADLSGANLRGANLYGANLSGANLRGADLSRTNLSRANLSRTDIRGANLSRANLSGANNVPYVPMLCPTDGEFTAWKKVKDTLIKLQIPADAKRSSATTSKCRCDKAMVLDITCIETGEHLKSITNENFRSTTYTVGQMVYPDTWDEIRWNECSNGIHFFIDRQSAIDY